MPLSITNTFTAGSPAIATQVNTNFTDIKTYIDTLVPKVNDAVFTVFPELPVGTPTSVQAAPRSYVDTNVNKMSGQITNLHTTARSQTTPGTYEVVSDQDFVIPSTVTEAVTFLVQAGWVLGNNTGTSTQGLFKYEINWDLVGTPSTYALLGPATSLITSGGTASYNILSNDAGNLGVPYRASQAAAGKTVRIRFSVFQPTTANGGGLSLWSVTPKTLVTATREIPFA